MCAKSVEVGRRSVGGAVYAYFHAGDLRGHEPGGVVRARRLVIASQRCDRCGRNYMPCRGADVAQQFVGEAPLVSLLR